MTPIKFKVAAKTDVGLVRTNNEDNFQVSWDLSSLPMRWVNNEVHQLGEKGCLLVVADGMGGANAGEIASQIAIDTIKRKFVPEEITTKVISSADSINSFIKDSIISADRNIKTYATEHPETKGMGTTIVIAWIINDKLYIGWCGDSRAYIYNPVYGLIRLTKDHSYVQQLVDSSKLSEEEAFDFPDSNIITQCLSASPQKCHPDTLAKPIVLSNDDIVLLCTDGLCGMIRDTEINSILKSFNGNVATLSDDLVSGAIQASGADNVTLCLFYAISGLKKAVPVKCQTKKSNRRKFYLLFGFIAAIAIIFMVWLLLQPKVSDYPPQTSSTVIRCDSISELLSDSIVEDSIQKSNLRESQIKASPETEKTTENPIGNGNNLIIGLTGVQIPKTEEKSDTDIENDSGVDIISTPEIIVVKKPANKHIRVFLKNFDMEMSDFKKLNPDIDPNQVKVEDEIEINVYKRKL
ncbi:MAG: protein phosphatase 2C domain-containing protein [Muribaculaceae bacterium]|nr:protein phosphatase 2C domain-containing protein [Muribaculaceae bacterium]